MIFVTVGTQLPFPRLIDAMEACAATGPEPVVAQTGPGRGDWPHLTVHAHLPPEAFDAQFTAARVVVAHAGMGTVLSARRHGKPLILVPRRHDLGEHRNDHQMATAREVERLPGVHIAWEVSDLPDLLAAELEAAGAEAPSEAKEALIAKVRGFIGGA